MIAFYQSVKRTAELKRILKQSVIAFSFTRPLHGRCSLQDAVPALKYWAISSRPLIADSKPLFFQSHVFLKFAPQLRLISMNFYALGSFKTPMNGRFR